MSCFLLLMSLSTAVSMTAEREEETATELEEEFETHIESFHEVRVTADKGQSKAADRMVYRRKGTPLARCAAKKREKNCRG